MPRIDALPAPGQPASPSPPPAPAATPAQPAAHDLGFDAAHIAELGARLVSTIDTVLAGHHDVAETSVATLLAGGNLLIEDIPGGCKTLLAQAIARAVGGTFGRVQGTPDLLPGDVVGTMLPVRQADDTMRLEFRAGPIFANVVVVDELNRATPRTQSALLEAAEEHTVTVDGISHRLPDPFFLVATQNPIDVAGTYGLGEGSLDRFAAVVTPGRAAPEDELEVLAGRRGRSMLPAVDAVADPSTLTDARRRVAHVFLAEPIAHYVLALLGATRSHPHARLGASTRAGVSLVALARARAMMSGRSYVVPDDVRSLAVSSLGHRVLVDGAAGATTAGRTLVEECVNAVPVPTA